MKGKVDLKISTTGDNLVDDLMSITGNQQQATEEQKEAIVADMIRRMLSDPEPIFIESETDKYSLTPNRNMYSEHKIGINKQQDSQKRVVEVRLMTIQGLNCEVSNIYDTSLSHIKLFDKATGKRFLVSRILLLDLVNRQSQGYLRKTQGGDEFYMRVEVEKVFLTETM